MALSAAITFGLITTSKTEDTKPTSIPMIAPSVLNPFQKIVSNRTGTFALAATAKVRAVSTAMFKLCALRATRIETTEIPTAAMRAALNCSLSLT